MTDKARILTIDDDHLLRESMAIYLEDCGYAVIEADSGNAGLVKAWEEGPDVILLDLRMPGKDGLQVLAELGEMLPEVPVIIVSGAGDMGDVIEALRLGAWDFTLKPIHDLALLEASIKRALRKRQLQQENNRYREHLEEEVRRRTASLEDEIDRHRRLEEEKCALEKQVRMAQKMESLGTIAAGIAHDFNNIITGINGFAELAESRVENDPLLMDYLAMVRKSGNRAKDLVRQILVFCRQREQRPTIMRLNPVVKESIKLLRATLPPEIELKSRLVEALPSVMADPTQIHQVIMNLCTNARQAMPEGGVMTVSLDSVRFDRADPLRDLKAATYVELLVKDSGIGMSGEVLERIFEPYFTTKEREEGTGLGLSVVHGIIKAIGGAVLVDSIPGKGSSFRVLIPALDIDAGAGEGESVRTQELRGGERILFVDDELAISATVSAIMENYGYQATVVNSPKEALRIFKEGPHGFDLVITDYAMPYMTGIVLARELLALRQDLPIILVSGYADLIGSKETSRSLGFRRVLYKPFTGTELLSTVRGLFDGLGNE